MHDLGKFPLGVRYSANRHSATNSDGVIAILVAALQELIPLAGYGALDSHDPRILRARQAVALAHGARR